MESSLANPFSADCTNTQVDRNGKGVPPCRYCMVPCRSAQRTQGGGDRDTKEAMQTEAKRNADSLKKQGCAGKVANQYVTKRPAMLQWLQLQRISDREGA